MNFSINHVVKKVRFMTPGVIAGIIVALMIEAAFAK